MGFADFMLGSRPEMTYTDEQQGIMDWAEAYGEQFDPTYGRNLRMMNLYDRGGVGKGGKDKSHKLTARFNPYIRMRARQRDDAVNDYMQQTGSALSPGGTSLATGGAASLRAKYDNATGDSLGSMYTDFGENLDDSVRSSYEAAKARELQARQLQAGVSGQPFDNSRRGGFLNTLMEEGLRVGSAALKKSAGIPI